MGQIKVTVSLLFLTLSLQALAANYPMKPDPRLTPGELCAQAVEYRYPERIAYCGRDVSTELKNEIFVSYRKLGFTLSSQTRSDYKIDHFFPLCMGGSNEARNLWPQHISIYQITDNIEALLCDKMKKGKLSQRQAVAHIISVKNDLSKAPALMRTLNAM